MLSKLKVFIVFTFILIAPSAWAQSYQAATTKSKIEIAITPGLEDEIYLVFKGNNREKQNFELKVDGPDGLKVSIRTAMSKKGQAAITTAKQGPSYPTKVFTQNGAGKMVYELGGSSGGEVRDPECGCLTDAEINNWIELLASYGQFYTRELLCQQVPPPFGGICPGQPGGNSNSAPGILLRSFISRDQCSSDDHLAIIKLNLSSLDKSAGGTITLKGKFKGFKGKRSCSIKPKGEGKYPTPIFLASPVGSFFDLKQHSVNITSWHYGKRTVSTNLNPVDGFYYPPVGPLMRTPLAYSIMTGAKGTIEVIKDFSGYSVCATLVAKRQSYYGYPK